MIAIEVENIIREKCPGLRIVSIECEVRNSEYSLPLWQKIDAFSEKFRASHPIEDINQHSAIRATRMAYKSFGKDPNRYRPSAEALCRRIVRGLPLYPINTLVDVINLISLHSGHSIGGFDADRIEGNLKLGIGQKDELFHAIGRGLLNIEGLPVYRDNRGGIGTPTSDEERTKIDLKTKRLLMIINAYSGEDELNETVDLSKTLLADYALIDKNSDFQINLY